MVIYLDFRGKSDIGTQSPIVLNSDWELRIDNYSCIPYVDSFLKFYAFSANSFRNDLYPPGASGRLLVFVGHFRAFRSGKWGY